MVARGLAASRGQAQRLILAGQVRVNGRPASKPGQRCAPSVAIEVLAGPRFVSRGGEKLAAALDFFGFKVDGLVCVDIGSSTGGFTDCLLQNDAARVYAIDVGKGQLHWKLRNDPRVVVMEGINARFLKAGDLPEKARFAAVDVSFISLTKVLPAVIRLLEPPAWIVTLIKPQFEVGRKEVGKGGVVRNANARAAAVEKIRRFGITELGLRWVGVRESPLRGPAGNVEYLAAWELVGTGNTAQPQ